MTNPKSRAAAGGTRRTEPVASRDGRAGGQPRTPAGMGLRPSRTLPQIRQAFHVTRVDSRRGARR